MSKELNTQHSALLELNSDTPVIKMKEGCSTVNLSPELTFLIACCQAEHTEENTDLINTLLNTERLTLNALIALANRHGILPLVYKTLKKLSNNNSSFLTPSSSLAAPAALAPSSSTPLGDPQSQSDTNHESRCNPAGTRTITNYDILSAFKQQYMGIAQKNMLMTAELLRIMKLLEANNIEALAFKGPALAQMAYGDITMRQFGDLDILIKRADIPVMIDLLLAEGYTPQLELDPKMREIFLHALNVIGFYKSSSNILIEVHWELLSKNYAIIWDEETLWEQQREYVSINGTNIPVLPYEEQLLYLCAHGSKHLFERIEWICDINRTIRSNPDINWQSLLSHAEKRGIKRMLFLGVSLCQIFLGLEIPQTIQSQIQEDNMLSNILTEIIEINYSERTTEGKSYGTFGLLWKMRENLKDRILFAWHALFSPKFDDFKSIALPKKLFFLYPFIRPFRLVAKYLRHPRA